MKCLTNSLAGRLLVLASALALSNIIAPLAIACTIVVPPGHIYLCKCDPDCACICIQIG
jgi:hypothetical protein